MTLFRLECPKQEDIWVFPETPNGQVARGAPLSKHGNFSDSHSIELGLHHSQELHSQLRENQAYRLGWIVPQGFLGSVTALRNYIFFTCINNMLPMGTSYEVSKPTSVLSNDPHKAL